MPTFNSLGSFTFYVTYYGVFYKLIRRGPILLAQNSLVKSGILRMASFSHPQMGILKTHCEFYDFYTKMELTKKIDILLF